MDHRPIKPLDPRPPRVERGWAPGNYHSLCFTCARQFIGDKRAWRCADCAYFVYEPSNYVAPEWDPA